jgi:alanyl-tRNA synthetase
MEKLFWNDPYQTECTATVTSIDGNTIKLDQSIFYAFSGGQESDTGTIAGISVIQATKEGDKENIIDITYELKTKPTFSVGDTVKVKIDKEKRAQLRKLHSVAHVMYYFVIEKLGKLKIVGSNITSTKARMDFIYDKPINEILPEIETNLNTFLTENHAITSTQDENKPDLRWWKCEEWAMPCGGTHVKSTKEIGVIKLKRKNIGAGKERIEVSIVQELT